MTSLGKNSKASHRSFQYFSVIGLFGKICAFDNFFFLRSITTFKSFYILCSIGTLNTLNFLRSNTMQISKSPDIYTTQNISDYATDRIYFEAALFDFFGL